jgi:hypothetical protein
MNIAGVSLSAASRFIKEVIETLRHFMSISVYLDAKSSGLSDIRVPGLAQIDLGGAIPV